MRVESVLGKSGIMQTGGKNSLSLSKLMLGFLSVPIAKVRTLQSPLGEGRRVTNKVRNPNRTLNHINVHSLVVGKKITV